MPEILIGKNLALEFLQKAPLSPASRMIAKLAIDSVPVVDAEPVRHGRWLPIEADGYADGAPVCDKWECSECGHEHDGEEDTLTDYCPDCGRKMYVDDDSGSGVGQTFSPD